MAKPGELYRSNLNFFACLLTSLADRQNRIEAEKFKSLHRLNQNHMNRIFISLVLAIVICSCNQTEQSNSNWLAVYKNDKQGNTIAGSKQELINAIRKGASIRIGWGAKGKNHSIEHLSDPIWLAILEEKEVIAHLDPQMLSAIDWEKYTAHYADTTLVKNMWRVVLDTQGNFDAIWYHPITQKIIERRPQNHTITWFIKNIDLNTKVQPLYVDE